MEEKNEEKERERRLENVEIVDQEVQTISKKEVRTVMKTNGRTWSLGE